MYHYQTFSIMCLSLFQIQNFCQFWSKSGFSQKDTYTAFSFLFPSDVSIISKQYLECLTQPFFCIFDWCVSKGQLQVKSKDYSYIHFHNKLEQAVLLCNLEGQFMHCHSGSLAQSFYHVNYGSSIITSKRLSNNLRNENIFIVL
jgi:hypothetical protein